MNLNPRRLLLASRDNNDEAAQAADDRWSEFGSQGNYDDRDYTTKAVTDSVVEIFGSNTCTYCAKAKQLCSEKVLPYRYMNIDEDEDAFNQLIGRIKTWKTVPQIFIGPIHIGGYDDLVKYLGADHD
jgi:glutaredoxin